MKHYEEVMEQTRKNKDAIEAGLQLLVKFNRQTKIKDFRGKLKWGGNLDEMRTDK